MARATVGLTIARTRSEGGAGVVQATTQDELHAADVGADDRPAAEANLILLAHYLQFLSTRPNNEYLIQATLKHFHFAILKKDSIDVHSAAFDQTSSDQARRLVIKAYYLARHSIAHSFLDFPAPPVGKLWKSDEPKKKLAGVFGGQGVNETLIFVSTFLDPLGLVFAIVIGVTVRPSTVCIVHWLNQPSLAPPRCIWQALAPPKLISITAESEGIPTPMLAVTGLLLGQLQKSVDEVSEEFSGDYNSPLPDAQVSLFNGSKAFVVTGHPRTLAGLVSLLKKSKADPSRDQSKV
ncbi:hypothetical protein H4Q26_002274 [Puccinia striiformis f. sp. tritici PST-130]|nr:hypothetical protein H4Q26_002274 [Puccinia striiformis f. sp. tritici PST-130]